MAASYDLFISFTQKDGEIAASLATQLHDVGVTASCPTAVFLLPLSGNQRCAKRSARRKSVLLLMTPRSKASLWVAAEAGAAWVLQRLNSCVTGCYRMQTVTGLSYQGIELIGPSFLSGFIVN